MRFGKLLHPGHRFPAGSLAQQHLPAKTQPFIFFPNSGGMPAIPFGNVPSILGTALSSACVYGWAGFSMTSAVVSYDPPPYITATFIGQLCDHTHVMCYDQHGGPEIVP